MAIFEYTYRIGLRDVGHSNKITNKGILGFMEDIAGMHSEAAGYGLNRINETHLTWVLLNWKVKILQRPIYDTDITIKTWSRYSNKFYSYRDFEMYDNENHLLAIATTKWTLISTETGALTKIEPEMIEKYHPENRSVFPELEVEKLAQPTTFLNKSPYIVQRSNIDINQHMHNLYYIDLAYEILPEEIYSAEELNHIEIMYKRQIRFGDQICCYYTKENETHIVTIKSEDEKYIHAIIKLY